MIETWKLTTNSIEEIHFDDRSSLDAITRQLPDGYYSTFRTYGGGKRVVGLIAHLRRLPNIDASFLRRQLNLLLEPYRPDEQRVRVMLTMQGELYISMEPLKLLPREVYENGVHVITTEKTSRKTPRLKTTAFISSSEEERKHIAQAGVFEALLVKNGKILEGMTSNFFYTRAERASTAPSRSDGSAQHEMLYTAQRNILLGITRTMVIRAARGEGIGVKYQPLEVSQLVAVKEAFITSSSRGVVPVVQIDEVMIGEGKPGEMTKQLSAAYEAYILKKAEKI